MDPLIDEHVIARRVIAPTHHRARCVPHASGRIFCRVVFSISLDLLAAVALLHFKTAFELASSAVRGWIGRYCARFTAHEIFFACRKTGGICVKKRARAA